MKTNQERERILEKMFDAALKETFSRFTRKYDRELVLKIWTEIAGSGNRNFRKWKWKPETTISEALTTFEVYCASIERKIQKLQKKIAG